MEKRNYIMEYLVADRTSGKVIKQGRVKAKMASTEFEAKAGFGKRIERDYPNGKLEIISCREENMMDVMESILNGKFRFPGQ